MRTSALILESVIESYNQKLPINYVDLRDLHTIFGECKEINDLIKNSDEKAPLNYVHVRNLDLLINGMGGKKNKLRKS